MNRGNNKYFAVFGKIFIIHKPLCAKWLTWMQMHDMPLFSSCMPRG